MKSSLKINLLLCLSLALGSTLVGCKKADKLLEAGENVETMNATTAQMQANMNKMNQTMETMSKGMDQTNSNMSKMVAAVHDQQVVIPFQELLKPENSRILSPIPERMMPYGKKMAEAARADELIETTYLWLKAIDETYPDKDLDNDGNEIPYTAAQIAAINHEKLARYMALNVLAGFTPESTVKEIIQSQIIQGGRYRLTAYQFLMLRTQFLRDVLLDQSLLALPLSEIGQAEEAVKYMEQLDFIAKLPFANLISIKTKGFLKPGENVEEKLSPKDIAAKWKSIAQKVELDCKVQKQAYSGDVHTDEATFNSENERLYKTNIKIQQYLDSWKDKLN